MGTIFHPSSNVLYSADEISRTGGTPSVMFFTEVQKLYVVIASKSGVKASHTTFPRRTFLDNDFYHPFVVRLEYGYLGLDVSLPKTRAQPQLSMSTW